MSDENSHWSKVLPILPKVSSLWRCVVADVVLFDVLRYAKLPKKDYFTPKGVLYIIFGIQKTFTVLPKISSLRIYVVADVPHLTYTKLCSAPCLRVGSSVMRTDYIAL